MHPLLATMIANHHALELRTDADARRRDRAGRPETRKFSVKLPRRTPRVAHA